MDMEKYEKEKKSNRIQGIIMVIILAVLLILALYFAFGGEKNMRAIKNKFSNYTGGLNRVVEVYDVNGQLIKSYKGKFDIEYEDERILFDDEDGNRHIIYFKTGQVIVDEVKGE